MKASHAAGLHRRFYVLAWLLLGAGCCLLSSCSGKPPASTATRSRAPTGALPEVKPARFPKPANVRGIYLTAWSAGSKRKMDKILPMLKRTELNAVVIDVRDDGLNYFKNKIEQSIRIKANRTAVFKPEALLERLQKAGVYPIARIACFRDQIAPLSMPKRAVIAAATGKPWLDRSKHTWLDPYNYRNWHYIAEIVDHALDLGFPEIQLDYVRFPSEGNSSSMVFPSKKAYADPKAKPTVVVAAFGKFIADRVHKRGAVLSADIFGIVSSGGGDQGIGQELKSVVQPFDLVCPMVYPSHFHKGEYGIADPNLSPHLIVLKSLKDYAAKVPDKRIRPWLQDFSLGSTYGVKEVQSQIRAAREAGYEEYLLWNAGNKYTEAAVVDTSGLLKPKVALK